LRLVPGIVPFQSNIFSLATSLVLDDPSLHHYMDVRITLLFYDYDCKIFGSAGGRLASSSAEVSAGQDPAVRAILSGRMGAAPENQSEGCESIGARLTLPELLRGPLYGTYVIDVSVIIRHSTEIIVIVALDELGGLYLPADQVRIYLPALNVLKSIQLLVFFYF